MKRTFLASSCLRACGGRFSGLVAGAGTPADRDYQVEGTDGVYIFRNGNHQAMFIVTRTA